MRVKQELPKEPENPAVEFVDRYRKPIMAGLLIVIAIGLGLLGKDYLKQQTAGEAERLTNQIRSLEAKVKLLEAENTELRTADTSARQAASAAVAAGVSRQPKAASPSVKGIINLNTAIAAELDRLPGIGPTYAQRIIEYRDQHGGFSSIEEVMKVKGIGPKTFEKFRDKVTI